VSEINIVHSFALERENFCDGCKYFVWSALYCQIFKKQSREYDWNNKGYVRLGECISAQAECDERNSEMKGYDIR